MTKLVPRGASAVEPSAEAVTAPLTTGDELLGASDPFGAISDEPALAPRARVSALLSDARRGYAPLRKVFVQRPNTEEVRASVLSELVHDRQERALDAFLLLHALQPVLAGTPLALGTWAALLSTKNSCTTNGASKAFSALVDRKLVKRTANGRRPIFEPLLEDGSGGSWTRPGQLEEEGPGYFTLPYAYWTRGIVDKLTLPGKAMLLIMLAETQNPKTPTFSMAVERAQSWYGISERTAERGYSQLSQAGLLLVKVQKVADARHPAGRREVYHRALASPFATAARMRLQRDAVKGAKQRSDSVNAGAPEPPDDRETTVSRRPTT
jgi:hypothetical protein